MHRPSAKALLRVPYIAALVLAALGPLALRVHWEAKQELAAASLASANDDLEGEIVHLGRAARWYLPGASSYQQALDSLVAIGDLAQERGAHGLDDALRAYREARGAILATRTWNVHSPELLATLNHRIARLMVEQESRLGTDMSGEGRAYQWHRELLDGVPAQRSALSWAASAVFLGWLVSVYFLCVSLAQAFAQQKYKVVVFWAVVTVVGLPVWIYLMHLPATVVPP